jgi:predicted HTH domain antitoxin
MPEKISIEIPREVLLATRMTPEEIKQELAIHLYQLGKLSLGKAYEIAGVDIWTFQQLLGIRGISIHYTLEDYQEDLATLRELGRI